MSPVKWQNLINSKRQCLHCQLPVPSACVLQTSYSYFPLCQMASKPDLMSCLFSSMLAFHSEGGQTQEQVATEFEGVSLSLETFKTQLDKALSNSFCLQSRLGFDEEWDDFQRSLPASVLYLPPRELILLWLGLVLTYLLYCMSRWQLDII